VTQERIGEWAEHVTCHVSPQSYSNRRVTSLVTIRLPAGSYLIILIKFCYNV